MNGPRPDGSDADFASRWRERFEEFARSREDDAGIAGWTETGLATRLRFFKQRFGGASPGSVWLDVGCGAGTYSQWLAAEGLQVVGLDYSLPTLTKACERRPAALLQRLAFLAGDANRLPFASASFDGALCFGVLQAVGASGPVLQELARVLRPGATLWIDALNREGLAARAVEWRRRRRHKPRHLRYESARELEREIEAAAFVGVRRHWLPIAPTRFRALQPIAESWGSLALLYALPPWARLVSHSVVFEAQRGAH